MAKDKRKESPNKKPQKYGVGATLQPYTNLRIIRDHLEPQARQARRYSTVSL